jgi:type II secretory pathway pseudopilin PulG
MASRQEEKERRRRERMEAEQAAQRSASRKRVLQIGGGAVLAIAVIAAIAVVALGGGGSKADTSNLAADAKAAGCTLSSYKSEGRDHTTSKVKYKTNPPTSGDHNITPSLDGVYAPGNTPAKENYVHTLEHGRIEFQYAPGTSRHRIAQLETLQAEPLNGFPGYKTLLFQNNTNMRYAVAATAWGHLIGCAKFNDRVFDALRAFRKQYVDKAPESGAQPPNNTG